MNYIKIYDDLCNRGKLVDIKNTNVYYEKHHIKPVFMFKNNNRNTRYKSFQVYEGNPNTEDNITYLTAREHFIAHVLLYMIYKKDSILSNPMSKSLLLFFKTNKKSHSRSSGEIKNSRLYSIMREASCKEQSKFMKGKINVKDAITGEMIGLVSNLHENVLNGKWVHHSKGRKNSEAEIQMRRKMGEGEKNNNFKKLTPELEKIIFESLLNTATIIDGIKYIHYTNARKMINDNEYVIKHYKKLSIVFFRNKYGTTEKLIETYNNKSNMEKIYYKKYGKLKGTKNVKN